MDLVFTIGAVFCALAYFSLAGLAGLALPGRKAARHVWWLMAASGFTGLWALGPLLEMLGFVTFYNPVMLALEILRMLAWIGFLVTLVGLTHRDMDSWLKVLILSAFVLPVMAVTGNFLTILYPAFDRWEDLTVFTSGAGLVLLQIVGLLVLENLYRNSGEDRRWGTRYLCLGLCLFFVYDFFFYAESLLFKRFDLALADARPWVTGLAAPLIAVSLARVRYWAVDIHVSRQMVFHSATLIGAGVYLLAMSLVGYWIRQFGGEVGAVFQIAFLALAAVLLLAVLASGSFRARAQLFIARHFYSSKYDYRVEWLRFITTLGSGEESSSIAQRIVWAVTPIVDSTAAALWVADRVAGQLRPVVSWNYGEGLKALETDEAFVKRVREAGGAILQKEDFNKRGVKSLIPEWITQERDTWLVLPLVYRGRLNGILLLGQPRAPRSLDSEDRNLLSTIASQAASYLAEDRAANALAQARKMEEFNQRFTFVAHDLKNVVNQLSMLVSNAAKHADNPEFQKDMIATVANSVDRMNAMMRDITVQSEAQLASEPLETLDVPTFDLVALMRGFTADWQAQGARVQFDTRCDDLKISAKSDLLASALNHMVQNAVDASGPTGLVRLLLVKTEQDICIEVADNGPGMDAEFVETVFFQPFGTTKEGGYGIGGFQIRQQIKDFGAKLEIDTEPGQGTTLKIVIPLDKIETLNETLNETLDGDFADGNMNVARSPDKAQ